MMLLRSVCLSMFVAVAFGLAPCQIQAEEPAAGKQVAAEVQVERVSTIKTDDAPEKKITETVTVKFWLFLPEGYEAAKDDASAKKWPLLLFLHGSGERGNDLDKVKVHGPPKIVAADASKIPMIVISPQCQSDRRWSPSQLVQLVDQVAAKYNADSKRLYITGLSMGGYGTWNILADYPGKFAAAIPICGGGDPKLVDKMKGTPIWVFHGAKDQAVKLERSEEMVNALKKLDADIKLTVYPEAGHDSWTVTYDNPEVYQWLLEKSLP